ncbi:sugar phosphate permease [Thermosporothrix hazakensis]|jgi:MFS family permease|uniref:Sugar phosphate permease n=1 Tax=Thermosporothrix hazakensis TaxID=644383 RepID=A0A326U737_THEHA|nr:MFS transporter [Thermosporothrix hazakensis]PZW30608.1 sugar phosphate permease [Thermosporothrix hazakensis]GCE49470.1 MFS transporter [Thermosporothrix hazakensis]
MGNATSLERDLKPVKPLTRRQAMYSFILLLIINILNYTDRAILPVVQTQIKTEFHLSDTELGWLISSFLLVYGIATLPLGIWADYGKRKNIIALCVAIWSVATTVAGFTFNFIQLFLARSVLGIGEAGYAPASLSMIGDSFPKDVRGRMLSIWSIGNVVGTAIGMLLGGVVALQLGWRWAFYLVGLPGLIVAFLIWRAAEPQRGAFDNAEEGEIESSAAAGHGGLNKNFLQDAARIFRIPTYWILLGAFIASFFIVGAAQGWITTYIIRDFKLTEAQAGAVSGGTLAVGSIVGTLLGGWIGDYLHRRFPQGRLLISTIAFLLGAPLTFFALGTHALVPFICIFALAIVALSMCLGPLNAVIQDIIEPEIRSTAIGLALLIAHLLGDALSPIIIGAIADRSSLGLALQTTGPICLLVAGLICLIGLKTVAGDMKAMQARLQRKG